MIYKVKTTGEKRSDWVDKIREAWGTYGCGGGFLSFRSRLKSYLERSYVSANNRYYR